MNVDETAQKIRNMVPATPTKVTTARGSTHHSMISEESKGDEPKLDYSDIETRKLYRAMYPDAQTFVTKKAS